MPTGEEYYDAAAGRYKPVKHWFQSKVGGLAQICFVGCCLPGHSLRRRVPARAHADAACEAACLLLGSTADSGASSPFLTKPQAEAVIDILAEKDPEEKGGWEAARSGA